MINSPSLIPLLSFDHWHGKTVRSTQWGVFLENNNKFQTISLVRKRFKLFSFLTTRVQRKRFLGYKIEYFLLDFPILHWSEVGLKWVWRGHKSSSLDSFSKTRKRVQWTRFLVLQNESNVLDFWHIGTHLRSVQNRKIE